MDSVVSYISSLLLNVTALVLDHTASNLDLYLLVLFLMKFKSRLAQASIMAYLSRSVVLNGMSESTLYKCLRRSPRVQGQGCGVTSSSC